MKLCQLVWQYYSWNENSDLSRFTAGFRSHSIGLSRFAGPTHHLAILTDEEGACSIADGCGVLANAAGMGEPLPNQTLEFGKPEPMQDLSQPLALPTIDWSGAGEAKPAKPTDDSPLETPSIDWSKR